MVHTCTPTMEHSVCIPTYLLLARIVIIDKQVNISKIVYCTVLSLDYDLILFLYFYTEDNHKSKTLPSIFFVIGWMFHHSTVSTLFHTYIYIRILLPVIHSSIHSFIRPSSIRLLWWLYLFFLLILPSRLSFFILSQLIRPDETPEQVRSFIPSVRCRCCSCVKSSFLIYNILLFCVLFLLHIFCFSSVKMGGFFFTLNK